MFQDEHGCFPIVSHKDCSTTILNGKTLNLLDEIPSLDKIEAFRLNFTTESKDEVMYVIEEAKKKINNTSTTTLFNAEKDTRGYFNKEIL